jgi:hypothetical protein
MRRQQELVSRILMITNRTYQGITHRAGLDPESYFVEIEHVQRGLQIESNGKSREDPAEGKYQQKMSLVVLKEEDNAIKLPMLKAMSSESISDSVDPELYTESSLNSRCLSMIRTVPKYRPAPCDSPAKHRTPKGFL